MGKLMALFRSEPLYVPVLLLSGAALALSQPVITSIGGETLVEPVVAPLSTSSIEQQSITVVSAANFRPGSLAAEMIVSGFSNALPLVFAPVEELPLPTVLQGTKVVVTDSAGAARDALLFGIFNGPTFSGQVNFLIPAMTALGKATVSLEVDGQAVASGMVEIAAVAPGIFTARSSGVGVAAALFVRVFASGERQQGLIFDPARRQAISLDLGDEGDRLFLSLFGTGMRGSAAAGAQQAAVDVAAEVHGVPTDVLAVAESPEFAGLDQVAIGPVNRDLLSGKGEVDVELWFNGVSTGLVTAAFGGEVITPSPEITDVRPAGLIVGRTFSLTLTGSGLMPINRVDLLPDIDFTITNIAGAGTVATFDAMVGADAATGARTLAVVTPNGRSNRHGVEVFEAAGGGADPVISNLIIVAWSQMSEFYFMSALFDWQDPDGDLTWHGDIKTSARVEVRLTGTDGECVFFMGGPNVLNFPGVTMSQRPVAPVAMAGQAPIQAGLAMASVTLVDAAQNRSDTLTVTTAQQPVPGACDPNDPIVLTTASVDFPNR